MMKINPTRTILILAAVTMAILGLTNVLTHPDFRGRGYGTAVTAAVTESFLPSSKLIVLNVDPANRPARQIYERLGYIERGRLIERSAWI